MYQFLTGSAFKSEPAHHAGANSRLEDRGRGRKATREAKPIQQGGKTMRKLVGAGFSALAFAAALAPPANADPSPPPPRVTSSKLSMTAKITSFRATASGVVANGTLTGKLR